MTDGAASPARGGNGTLAVAVFITLVAQALVAMAVLGPAVLAPAAAKALGVSPANIGVFTTCVYAAAMFAGLVCGMAISRIGAMRLCQIGLVLAGAGLAIGGTGAVAGILSGALAIGLGYGVLNPATSVILARVTPSNMLALILSVKQTGVPLGGVIAGALLPTLALALGWQSAVQLVAAGCIVLAVLCEPARRLLDDGTGGAADGSPVSLAGVVRSVVAPIRLVMEIRPLRQLAIASMAYAATQMMLFAFLVAYVNIELGFSLVAAGATFSAAQTAGIVGRIIWGAIADRMAKPRRLLGALGMASALVVFSLTLWGGGFALGALTLACVALGSVAIGWNGIYFAEIVRAAPPDRVGAATGGAQFFTFAGALCGPAIATGIVAIAGRYSIAMSIIATTSLAMGALLAWRAR